MENPTNVNLFSDRKSQWADSARNKNFFVFFICQNISSPTRWKTNFPKYSQALKQKFHTNKLWYQIQNHMLKWSKPLPFEPTPYWSDIRCLKNKIFNPPQKKKKKSRMPPLSDGYQITPKRETSHQYSTYRYMYNFHVRRSFSCSKSTWLLQTHRYYHQYSTYHAGLPITALTVINLNFDQTLPIPSFHHDLYSVWVS